MTDAPKALSADEAREILDAIAYRDPQDPVTALVAPKEVEA